MKRRYKTKKTTLYKAPKLPKPEIHRYGLTLGGGGAGLASIGNIWYEHDMLGLIIAGVDSSNRVGRRIAVRSIAIKGVLAGGAIGTGGVDDYYNTVRMVVIQMKAAKSGTSLTPLNTAGISMHSTLNSSTVSGFVKLHKDHFYGFNNNPYAAGLCAPEVKEIDFYKRFKEPLVVDYSGITLNHDQTQIYIAMISDSSGVPNPGFVSGYYEVRFTDY